MTEKPAAQHVTVDLVGLREVAVNVRDQTSAELQPGFERCNKLMQHGVRFALRSPSGSGYAARHALATALTRHHHNCEAHLSTAAALSLAIDNILTNYADADHLAGSAVGDRQGTAGRRGSTSRPA